jgi:hypothetical protein
MTDRATSIIPLGIVLWLCGLATALSCCGASPEVRQSYAVEVARCIAAERAIVDRQGTTEAEDVAALAVVRAERDATLQTIGGAP